MARRREACVLLAGCCLIAGVALAQSKSAAPEVDTVKPGSGVAIRYTLSFEDGSVLDSNVSREPLRFVQGSKNVIPGINEAVLGMKLGDFKQVKVPPEKAYGPVDPRAFRPVPLDKLPPDVMPGTELASEDADGNPILMRVARIEGDQAVLDFNHPLAGETLVFQIEIVAIDPP